MRTPTKLLVVAGVILGLAVGVSAQSVPAPNPAPAVVKVNAKPIASIEGRDNFEQYCAACHGTDAKGAGPAARSLEVPPADLTLIVVREGGTFPAAHVRESICGNHAGVPLNGMPNWDGILRSVSVDEQGAKLRIYNLVQYIKSVQQG